MLNNLKRLLCVLFSCIIVMIVQITAYAETNGNISLNSHDGTVNIDYYESMKVITGFVPGDTVDSARAKFVCSDKLLFISPDGKSIGDGNSVLFSGEFICAADGNSVKDIGIICVFGDIDGNGRVTTADARAILRCALSLDSLSVVQRFASDCNNDGKVSSKDARTVLRAALKLDSISNPYADSGNNSAQAVAVYAYYTGGNVPAGTYLDLNNIKVLAVYSDASTKNITSGFTVEPTPLTSVAPGKKSFTVNWNGLKSTFTVTFTESIAEKYYSGSKVPDYGEYADTSVLRTEHGIGFVTYIYSVKSAVTDFAKYESYLNYLLSCGFTVTGKTVEGGKCIAVLEKKGGGKAATVYDFTNNLLYIAVT